MRAFRTALAAVGAALLTLALSGGPAHAATGEVVVFQTELQPLTTFENPDGCKQLPDLAHVLNNHTDQPVVIHADPFCATPGITVKPGHGSHVTPKFGSFSV
jgi:hypothetical protein